MRVMFIFLPRGIVLVDGFACMMALLALFATLFVIKLIIFVMRLGAAF